MKRSLKGQNIFGKVRTQQNWGLEQVGQGISVLLFKVTVCVCLRVRACARGNEKEEFSDFAQFSILALLIGGDASLGLGLIRADIFLSVFFPPLWEKKVRSNLLSPSK